MGKAWHTHKHSVAHTRAKHGTHKHTEAQRGAHRQSMAHKLVKCDTHTGKGKVWVNRTAQARGGGHHGGLLLKMDKQPAQCWLRLSTASFKLPASLVDFAESAITLGQRKSLAAVVD